MLGQRSHSVRAKTPLPEQTDATTLSELRPQIEKGSTTLQVNISSQVTVRSQMGATPGMTTKEIA